MEFSHLNSLLNKSRCLRLNYENIRNVPCVDGFLLCPTFSSCDTLKKNSINHTPKHKVACAKHRTTTPIQFFMFCLVLYAPTYLG